METRPTKIANEQVGGKEDSKIKRNADKRKSKKSGGMASSTTADEVRGQNIHECESCGSKRSAANCVTNSSCKSSTF